MEANIIEEVKTLETEVKEFANSQPYWAKYLCSEILAGNEITDAIINTSYSYLLETLGKSCKTLRNVWYMSACNGILTGHEAKQP